MLVRQYEGIPPDVVAIPTGLGHTVGGRWTEGVGVNPEVLVDGSHMDPVGGSVARQAVRVKLYKVEEGD